MGLLTTQFYSCGRKTAININDAQGSVPIETGGGGHSLPRCLTWSLANNSINATCYLVSLLDIELTNLFFFFLAAAWSLWDLRSPTRDLTEALGHDSSES